MGRQVLDVGGCGKLTDSGLQAVSGACPDLRALNVNGCQLLTDAGFAAVAAACPRLSRLSACGCFLLSDSGLSALALSCACAPLRRISTVYRVRLGGGANPKCFNSSWTPTVLSLPPFLSALFAPLCLRLHMLLPPPSLSVLPLPLLTSPLSLLTPPPFPPSFPAHSRHCPCPQACTCSLVALLPALRMSC